MTPSAGDSATYVFCLVQSARAPAVRGVPESVPGAGVPRVLRIDRDLWAVVADAPLDRFSSERLEDELRDVEAVSRHALAHASVVEFFFRRAPVIPLQLFTLFSGDDRVRQHVAGRARGLRTLFGRLRGLEEWGVRITLNPAAERGSPRSPSGRDYLIAKKQQLDAGNVPARRVVREATAALKSLSRLATKVRQEAFPPPGRNRPYVTGASFLVAGKKRAQWKKQVARLAADLEKRGHRLDVSGPWPPYHFASTGS